MQEQPAACPSFPSRLPNVGTTIFTVMSALAQSCNAVNLGQGFPDFDCDSALVGCVNAAMQQGLNQYPPMSGVADLREAISRKIELLYGAHYDAKEEVTVTAGATQAILTAVLCLAGPGDEVIVLEPCYDSYVPNIELTGARVVRVPLKPGSFTPQFDQLAAALSQRTRALIINSPHNPSGTVWTSEDMQRLADLLSSTNVVVISDEVYEHMVYAPMRHESVARVPQLARRSFIVSSFGKTYHVTGWKIGYVAAPQAMMTEFRKVHQFNVFTVNTPMQYGIAQYMRDAAPYLGLSQFYAAKRDLFRQGLSQTHFRLLPCQGTYFQCASIEDLRVPERDLSEALFCQWLTREIGVAAIPISAFYGDGFDQKVIRFCFAKKDQTLRTALERLSRL